MEFAPPPTPGGGGPPQLTLLVGGAAFPLLAAFTVAGDGGRPTALGSDLADLALAAASGLSRAIEAAVPSAVANGVRRVWSLWGREAPPPAPHIGPRAALHGCRTAPPCSGVLAGEVGDELTPFERVSLDPTGRLLLAGDGRGRVVCVDVADLTVVSYWKGLRNAQLGWAVRAQGPPLALLLSPKRGRVEAWNPLGGGGGGEGPDAVGLLPGVQGGEGRGAAGGGLTLLGGGGWGPGGALVAVLAVEEGGRVGVRVVQLEKR